jgi:hypothetical protein
MAVADGDIGDVIRLPRSWCGEQHHIVGGAGAGGLPRLGHVADGVRLDHQFSHEVRHQTDDVT